MRHFCHWLGKHNLLRSRRLALRVLFESKEVGGDLPSSVGEGELDAADVPVCVVAEYADKPDIAFLQEVRWQLVSKR